MKAISKIICAFTLAISVSCTNQNDPKKASIDAIHVDASADSTKVTTTAGAAITFVKTTHDFGSITQGEKAEYSFKFTNTGSGQLLISNAEASCGCTVPQFSKEPINPGESGFIKVIFDSDKRLDRFEKSIRVFSNTTPLETDLFITGIVIPKPEDQYKMLHE